MDQDSRFEPGMMKKYQELIEEHEKECPGMTALYAVNYSKEENQPIGGFRHIVRTITSGSIIPVDISIKIGGFDENLFIDEVDHEFCYRAVNAGYDLLEIPSILMHHTIGHRTYHHIGSFHFNTLNHSAFRRYYITRNRIYVMKKYPLVRKQYFTELIKMTMKIILVEDHKLNKLKYIMLGAIDGLLNRMGKLH